MPRKKIVGAVSLDDPKRVVVEVKEAYDRIAGHFSDTRGYLWKECVSFMDGSDKGSMLLDMGCGNCRNAIYAAESGIYSVGMDISSKLLGLAANTSPFMEGRLSLVQGDVTDIPFKSSSFDRVMYIAAIHHIPSSEMRLSSLEEIVRVTRPGGMVLVSAWALDQPRFKSVGEGIQDVFMRWDDKQDRYFHLFRKGELDALCAKAGLRIMDTRRERDNYYVWAKRE